MARRAATRSTLKRQPPVPLPIDRSNRFGAATQFFVTSFGGAQPVRLDSSAQATQSGIVGLADKDGWASQVATVGGSANRAEWSQAGIDLSGPFTFALRIKRNASSSAAYDRVFHGFGTLATVASNCGFLLDGPGEANPDRLYFTSGASGDVTLTDTPRPHTWTAVSTTDYETYVVTYDGTNGNFYRDGVLLSTWGVSGFPAASLPNPIRIGTDDASSNGAAVNVQFAHIMRGALTAADVAVYCANPWQTLLAPAVRSRLGADALGSSNRPLQQRTKADKFRGQTRGRMRVDFRQPALRNWRVGHQSGIGSGRHADSTRRRQR
jgi:hypothetical protein